MYVCLCMSVHVSYVNTWKGAITIRRQITNIIVWNMSLNGFEWHSIPRDRSIWFFCWAVCFGFMFHAIRIPMRIKLKLQVPSIKNWVKCAWNLHMKIIVCIANKNCYLFIASLTLSFFTYVNACWMNNYLQRFSFQWASESKWHKIIMEMLVDPVLLSHLKAR